MHLRMNLELRANPMEIKSDRGGYKQGATKSIVLDAHKNGLTREEVMRRNGLKYHQVYSCEYRNKVFLKSESGKSLQGSVKEVVINGIDAGMTLKELLASGKANKDSIRSAWRNLVGQ